MTDAAQELSGLRQQLVANFGDTTQRVIGPVLAQIDALLGAESPAPADAGPLLDQLEDLVEALLREAGWRETEGGRA